ncbi:dienelactone hydrolase family protein [Piscinibacter gummiphilus]|uniref:Carboxymethylenebutenolidase n=1 Tax=Piscinibacter gummiphilus TaxID=946333 RepID=A0A1W6LCB9_9BURK|nr:dienelactone hydrolase family protein [Piscinibacter gummiphilus]ARN21904.1 carboxymethylenebutenolidase [Piscinibacter gummiphilus]ATU66589.1 carboxymethylenebutenolidase [Piscinibacter gummiphilus]GLS93962.1 carboxymethylenebutenolidase [Piscinibacter gummiphilus]
MSRSEFDSLTPTRDFTRRSFVQTAVGSGFAAAVLPVSAQTITTDTAGLTAGVVNIPVGGSSIPAYRAAPAGKTGLPVILVLSEIFGVHEHIADVARRFAKLGYLAIAPELFIRQGDAKAYTDIPKLLSEVIAKVPDEQVMADLDASVAWAKANGGDTSRLGVTGFCWGGRQVWLYAAHNPAVKASVAWYGKLVGESTPLSPKQPVDVAGKLGGPVLGLYGGADAGIPLDSVDKMKAALASGSPAAKKSEFVVYPDTPHAFHADYRPSYRKEAAEDGWKRATAWFKANGVA